MPPLPKYRSFVSDDIFCPAVEIDAEFWQQVDDSGGPDSCWLWLGPLEPTGYGYIHLDGHMIKAHAFSLYLRTGVYRPKDAPHALHSCDNPPCVNFYHLRWGTPKENIQDCIERGRFKPFGRTMLKNR